MARRAKGDLETHYTELAAARALSRVVEVAEFADLVAFVVSERATYITGTAVNFDGGTGATYEKPTRLLVARPAARPRRPTSASTRWRCPSRGRRSWSATSTCRSTPTCAGGCAKQTSYAQAVAGRRPPPTGATVG